MKKILVLGAGLSASSLIRYLLEHAPTYNWQVRIVDQNSVTAKKKIAGNPNGVALTFNALIKEERWEEIAQADLVISMLPARFHIDIARDCLELKKNLITPSYVSTEMSALDAEVKAAGLTFMNEMGVDPGIDHMSAMKIIDEVKAKGGHIISFKSFCGGLIAPQNDNNPWNYKFTWNPRNVVLAGQGGTAQYIDHNQYKYIPYTQLFSRLDKLEIEGFGTFDGYPNRDSLSYRAVYGLEDIPTLYRGTLRRTNFCNTWNVFVQLGMTDDSYTMENSEDLTPRDFVNAFLSYETTTPVEDKFKRFLSSIHIADFDRFRWLGLFDSHRKIGLKDATPAQILEQLLVEKLVLDPEDKDMIVMVHQFEYELDGKLFEIESSMVNIGEDAVFTGMSNTVGLPIAICAKLLLTAKYTQKGVLVPTDKVLYEPVLEELTELGISFTEKEKVLN
jgi:saccharopine dehydrogenase-like NADP-dependent oxidoreductase